MLRRQVGLFQELEGIQGQALQSVSSGTFPNLEDLLSRQQDLMIALDENRGTLQPLLQEWMRLTEQDRDVLRKGPIGELLESVDTAAAKIQKRHQDQFDAPLESKGPPQDPDGDLGQRISRYRAGF